MTEPVSGPNNDGEPQISAIEASTIDLRNAAMQYLSDVFEATPDIGAPGACHLLLQQIVATLAEAAPPAFVRAGLLLAYGDTFEGPMSFIETADVKRALDAMSARKRAAGSITKGGIIRPGEDA